MKIPKFRSHLLKGLWTWEKYNEWLAEQGNAQLEREAVGAYNSYIVAKDGKCIRCGTTEGLTCSHFWTAKRKATKFDDDNCKAACIGCHLFNMEKEKQGEYRDIMLKLLGKKGYDALEKRAKSTKRYYAENYLQIIHSSYEFIQKKRRGNEIR